ncbi:hypothetical protein [Bacteroides bouchesdurhonensis]|uniref:hypothetical protein n=1 Tax=Bacteroides bouchesdurhonensis TaxID=1841855 RepID=UPI00101AE3B0|nr:hypothetical protein [Bacteroides bouchesdurhonensis]
MSELIRFVNHYIVYLFTGQTKDVCYSYAYFLYRSPSPFSNREFQRFLSCLFKEFLHCLIGIEPLYNGWQIILEND